MRDAVLVFSRFPRRGRVKTRLTPALGPAGCLRLHRALLLDTLDRIADLQALFYLFLGDCTEDEMRRFSSECELSGDLRLEPQQGRDLGERMWNALGKAGQETDRVIFLGTDTPTLPLSYIAEAQARLSHYPVVLGPVEDGGYYLLALSQPREDLFCEIDWGTSSVLEQTTAKLGSEDYTLLPPWYDVDTAADLPRLQQDLERNFDGFPERTHRVLQTHRRF